MTTNTEEKRWLSNPAIADYDGPIVTDNAFTVQGAAFKSLFLLAILAITFAFTWNLATEGYAEAYSAVNHAGKPPDSIAIPGNVIGMAALGCLGGFVVAMVIIFAQGTAPYLSPVYAGLEGLALGALSAGFEAQHPGIVVEAVVSTLGVTFGMLVIYGTGLLRPTKGFMVGLMAAMVGILFLYLADIVMQLCGSYVPVVHDSGPWGIGLQIAIVGVAALNLIVDFGLIAQSAENKAPKSYEWYGAFSLLVTLVWLYMEILRLLAKLRK